MLHSTSSRSDLRERLVRGLSALPDAITAAGFLLLWCFPLAFGPDAVRNGILLALVEFVTIHASVMLGHFAFSAEPARTRKAASLAIFGGFYTLFVGGFALAFRAWWPVFGFGWLLAAKFAAVFASPADNAHRLKELRATWGVSVLIYLGAVFLTSMFPVPRLGISAAVRGQLDLPGSGLWIEEPHRLIAFGVLYFGLLSWSRWRGWKLPENLPVSR